jgi:hypothetical protein
MPNRTLLPRKSHFTLIRISCKDQRLLLRPTNRSVCSQYPFVYKTCYSFTTSAIIDLEKPTLEYGRELG